MGDHERIRRALLTAPLLSAVIDVDALLGCAIDSRDRAQLVAAFEIAGAARGFTDNAEARA